MESTTYIYKHASGVDVPATVYFSSISSPATTPKARPIALLFHPGGFVLGSSAMISQSQIRALANMGFVVVTPEYRLCPQVSLYEGPIQDAKDCLVWVQEKLPALLEEDGAEAEDGNEGKRMRVDGGRVVVAGYSCGGNLALHLATVPNPPKAILAFYPTIYFVSPLYHTPFLPFANIPTPSSGSLEAVHTGPQALTSAPMFSPDGKPNLDTPRTAWMLDALKTGTHLSSCVKDGALARCDPATLFASAEPQGKWPSTCFVHGTEDVFALEEWSWRAKSELEEAGTGDVEVVRVEGAGHVFDILLTEGNELFEGPVMEGLRFLEQRA